MEPNHRIYINAVVRLRGTRPRLGCVLVAVVFAEDVQVRKGQLGESAIRFMAIFRR